MCHNTQTMAVDAKIILSRNKDVLSRRDAATEERRDFMTRYSAPLILTPPEVLALLTAMPQNV